MSDNPQLKLWVRWCVCLLSVLCRYGMDLCNVNDMTGDYWTTATARLHELVTSRVESVP